MRTLDLFALIYSYLAAFNKNGKYILNKVSGRRFFLLISRNAAVNKEGNKHLKAGATSFFYCQRSRHRGKKRPCKNIQLFFHGRNSTSSLVVAAGVEQPKCLESRSGISQSSGLQCLLSRSRKQEVNECHVLPRSR